MPDDTFRRSFPEISEVATSLAGLRLSTSRECPLDVVPVGWRRAGHIWVPAHARIQDVTGVRATDSPERGR